MTWRRACYPKPMRWSCRAFGKSSRSRQCHPNISIMNIIQPYTNKAIFVSKFDAACHSKSLHWRHNGHESVSNHQPHDCLLNHLFRRRWKKISKLRVTGLCARNSPETAEFPAQMASNAENTHRVMFQQHWNSFIINDCNYCVIPLDTQWMLITKTVYMHVVSFLDVYVGFLSWL